MYLAFVCFIWYRRYPSKNVAVGIPRGFREMRRSRAESTYIYEYLCSDEPWGPLWLHFRRWGGYWSRLPAFLHAYQQVEKNWRTRQYTSARSAAWGVVGVASLSFNLVKWVNIEWSRKDQFSSSSFMYSFLFVNLLQSNSFKSDCQWKW